MCFQLKVSIITTVKELFLEVAVFNQFHIDAFTNLNELQVFISMPFISHLVWRGVYKTSPIQALDTLNGLFVDYPGFGRTTVSAVKPYTIFNKIPKCTNGPICIVAKQLNFFAKLVQNDAAFAETA
jgi:hypothetical protein